MTGEARQDMAAILDIAAKPERGDAAAEAPGAAALPPAAVPRSAMPWTLALGYFAASLFFGITQGLGINIVTANLPTF